MNTRYLHILPPANKVAGRKCFYTCLSFCLQGDGHWVQGCLPLGRIHPLDTHTPPCTPRPRHRHLLDTHTLDTPWTHSFGPTPWAHSPSPHQSEHPPGHTPQTHIPSPDTLPHGHTHQRDTHLDTPTVEMAIEAGGTHPNGMNSCC